MEDDTIAVQLKIPCFYPDTEDTANALVVLTGVEEDDWLNYLPLAKDSLNIQPELRN